MEIIVFPTFLDPPKRGEEEGYSPGDTNKNGNKNVFGSLPKTYAVYMKVLMFRDIYGPSCGGVQSGE